MGKLTVFNTVSLDGYFTDPGGDMSWAHQVKEDAEWNAFVEKNAGSGGMLLFGRVTYDLMRSYWPTPTALKAYPVVARRMNEMPKVVFSRTVEQPTWSNTIVVNDGMSDEVRRLKRESESDMTILGSGSVVQQLTDDRLIDEYHFVVTPIVLGAGRTMFAGIRDRLALRRLRSRTFTNGNVLVSYAAGR
jgi:dihydrofolate reductase